MSWRERADALADEISADELHPRVNASLCSLPEGSSVALACSGGVDSLALLLLVWAHYPRLRSGLTVLHFDHGVRGEVSRQDADYVREVAGALGVSCVVASRDGSDEAAISEASLRDARHGFFRQEMQARGISRLLLGHQAEDVLETLMMRVARSSGLGGLAAPRPVQAHGSDLVYLRPLLNLSKVRLLAVCEACGIEHRHDASNDGLDFERNRLRNRVIPLWQEGTQYSLVDAALRVREQLDEADAALDAWVDQWKPFEDGSEVFELGWGMLPPIAVLRRALLRWLHELGQVENSTPAWVEGVLESMQDGGDGKWSLGEGFVCKQGSRLQWEEPKVIEVKVWGGSASLVPGSVVFTPFGGRIDCSVIKNESGFLNKLKSGLFSESNVAFVDLDKLGSSRLRVRAWEAGDRCHCLNAPGTRKLQDCFVDRKIPVAQRRLLPVISSRENAVIWCPGLPPAHAFRIEEQTNEILQLTYTSHP